jgi:hypothetical protein
MRLSWNKSANGNGWDQLSGIEGGEMVIGDWSVTRHHAPITLFAHQGRVTVRKDWAGTVT